MPADPAASLEAVNGRCGVHENVAYPFRDAVRVPASRYVYNLPLREVQSPSFNQLTLISVILPITALPLRLYHNPSLPSRHEVSSPSCPLLRCLCRSLCLRRR